jgi:HEAT repeat protein
MTGFQKGVTAGFAVVFVFALVALAALATDSEKRVTKSTAHRGESRIRLASANFSGSGAEWDIPSASELMDEMEGRGDSGTRRRAAWWLGEHEEDRAVSSLERALGDGSGDVRLVAAWALGEIKDPHSIDPLIRALEEDDDPLVREMAALSLGEIEDDRAADALRRARDREADLQEPVRWALGEISGKSHPVWAGRTYEVSWFCRDKKRAARPEVKGLDYSEDVSGLLRQLRSGSDNARREAAFNLGLLGMADAYDSLEEVERVIDHLIEALRDPAPEVRARAVWSLDEINPSRSGYCRKHFRNHG